MNNWVLIAGGAGYIGSHTAISLVENGYRPVVIDNMCNSSPESIRRVESITGIEVPLIQADLRDSAAVRAVFDRYAPSAVIHFAGLKAVGESVERPLAYYDCNLGASFSLFDEMLRAGCHSLVFSSSATIYGEPQQLPLTESHPIRPTNPYGHGKAMIEQIIMDLGRARPDIRAFNLRYFNPVGAHPSGLIGEDPSGIPNNLMPFVSKVAVGRLPRLQVFGSDWPTPDGSGVRDYIHVMDLAEAHVAAVRALPGQNGVRAVNIGTGRGTSVLELVAAFSAAAGQEVPWEVAPRRAGDIARCYADPALARNLLGWSARRSLADMCEDTWRWQSRNPDGYGEA
ncbi:UDP-glucose 4-epimerase GalE [Algiphilus sp. NNCM1]|uniref:UDP-glucose 4-epimerase GalE n=1 Tax=Algiphilus sp. TaxID=1872431 RepID=UPI001CA7626B|nr:UDP-glucose 4-epimerase GalE [Algiphilus sp.]MBY8965055.1 UDP-glucose 4-epimerase GalE [Algiphilus acroporae]MCI5104208.1 UDP-glucose 4-epimerase GalE [Algiphilus sp.]